jgi:hypothetical protein
MQRKTKKRTVSEVEHKGLKLFGALFNLLGMALYGVYNVKVVLASLALLRNEFPNKTFDELLKLVTKSALIETGLIFGTIVVFELINYYLYLNKKRDVLLGFITFEIMAFMVAAYMFGFTYIFSYVVLLPAITGFINYYILVNEGE